MSKPQLILMIMYSSVFSIALAMPTHQISADEKFHVGYSDTIIFLNETIYQNYNYHGEEPMFLQIWHPAEYAMAEGKPLLRFGDLMHRTLPDSLKALWDELCRINDEMFVDYNIRYNVVSAAEADYSPHDVEGVLDQIKQLPTNSFMFDVTARSSFPVIVYHHGSQGNSAENHLMAEYFAKRGFIFISSNFHLPYPDMPYGLHESVRNDHRRIKTLLKFAHELTSGKVFYVGHSWGAQVGWALLHEEGLADGFVSLETTIEFKRDSLEIKDKWPFVYQVVRVEKKHYGLPVLMFANTQADEPFRFFQTSNPFPVFSVSAKDEFAHESYLSSFHLRQLLHPAVFQADADVLAAQRSMYYEHLDFIHSFINAIVADGKFDFDKYSDRFYIH